MIKARTEPITIYKWLLANSAAFIIIRQKAFIVLSFEFIYLFLNQSTKSLTFFVTALPIPLSAMSFGSGDFSLLGTPLSKVESFSNTSYDLLVNYFKEDNPYLQLVSLNTNAKFRVGFSGVDNRLNDLMFSLSETDSTLFCKQMNTYLNNINTG